MWSVENSRSKPRAWKNLAAFPQLRVSRNTASIPSVAMSGFLSGRLLPWPAGGVEVGAQGVSHQRRRGQARLDGVVLDLLDQPDRQIHVELLDLFITHSPDASMLEFCPGRLLLVSQLETALTREDLGPRPGASGWTRKP